MPVLSITTTLGQTNSTLTIIIAGSYNWGAEYIFRKIQVNTTHYSYNLPLPIVPNGTKTISVGISSPAGRNSTTTYLEYTHTTEVIVSEPVLLQTALLVGFSPLFYLAIRKRREQALPE